MPHELRADAGFTLFETLIAMTVMALLAAVLLRGVVAVRADAAWFDDRTAGTRLATAVLDEALGNRRLHDGTYRGVRDGRRWTLTAAPADAEGQLLPPVPASPSVAVLPGDTHEPRAAAWRLQRLAVAVDAARRPVVLETVRLATSP